MKTLTCLLSIVYCLLATGPAQASEEKFIYDSGGRRDPFVPLVDKNSTTGLRTTFVPPEVKIRLPVAINVKGILWSGKEYFAIINDQVMREGQDIGKIKIKEIKKDRVILEYGEREFSAFLRKEKAK